MHPAESAKDGADGYMEEMILCEILLYLISVEGGSFLEKRSDVGNDDSGDTAMSTRVQRYLRVILRILILKISPSGF